MSPAATATFNMEDPDVRLMLRVKQGDTTAFATLMAAHQRPLTRMFHARVGDWQKAEDLTQEAFLRVFAARDRYQPSARFSTWLYRIAANLASNARRDRHRRRECRIHHNATDEREAESLQMADPAAKSGLECLESNELRMQIRSAVRQLPSRQQTAVRLRRYEGLSYREIGDRLELSAVAVKSLLMRARGNLRTQLRSCS